MAIWMRQQGEGSTFYDIRNGEGGEVIDGVTGFTINAPAPGEPATVTLTVLLESIEIY